MHPSIEGLNTWDVEVAGRKNMQESFGNPARNGTLYEEVWQDPNEPVYTWIAYSEVYEPWDCMITAGGRKVMFYAQRLQGMLYAAVGVLVISVLVISVFSINFGNRLRNSFALLQDGFDHAGQGD